MNLQRTYPFIFLIGIFLIGAIIYSNTFQSPFQFDDKEFIVDNSSIQNIYNFKDVFRAGWPKARFISFLTFAINFNISQLNPFSYHVFNLAVHILTAFLVWMFIRLLYQTPSLKQSSLPISVNLFAAMVAIIFLAHPIQSEAVTYITQRFASLATAFYLLTICLYIKGRLSQNRKVLLIGAGLSAITCMLTKQIAFTLPINICLIEFLFLKKERSARIKTGYIILLLAFLLIIPSFYRFNFAGIISAETMSGSHWGDKITSLSYFITQPRVIIKYIQLLFIPIGQNILHDFPLSKSIFDPFTIVSFILILGLIGFAIKIQRRHLLCSFGIYWFFLCLSIESTFVPLRHVIFEHRLYLPSIGFFMVIVYWITFILKDAKKCIILFSICAAVLSVLTFQRNNVWSSEISLWKDSVSKSPRLVKPRIQLGMAYLTHRQPTKALSEFNAALEIAPYHAQVYYNRAITSDAMGRWQEAINDYSKAIEFSPDHLNAFYNRGNLYGRNGQHALALSDFTTVKQLNENHLPAINNRGITYRNMKRFNEAIEDFNYVLAKNPQFISAYINRGNTYNALEDYTSAIKDYSSAIRLNAYYSKAYLLRSFAYKKKGMFSDALDDIQIAQSLGVRIPSEYIEDLKEAIYPD